MKATMRTNCRISQSSRQIRCSWSSIVSSLIHHAKIHMKTKTSETSEGVSYRKYQTTFRYADCA